MKFKYIWHGYCNNSDVGLHNKLRTPYCNTYVQFILSNYMYVAWIMLWNLITYDMDIVIIKMLDLKISSTS
jgi:hypothetical protein